MDIKHCFGQRNIHINTLWYILEEGISFLVADTFFSQKKIYHDCLFNNSIYNDSCNNDRAGDTLTYFQI